MPSESLKSLLADLQAGLDNLEARSQRRALEEIHGINLCSNDYLGLAENPALKDAVLQAVSAPSRIGGTGSRLLSGHALIWNELEEEFASFAGSQSALYFGSGYAANLGLLSSLACKNDLIFSDALNHASIIDGVRLSGARKIIYPHLDLQALELALREHQHHAGRKFIVTETIFSMDGDAANIEQILMLAEKYGGAVIVDEAHATAVHGPRGRGLASRFLEQGRLIAAVHTCGKALASAGAFVCCSAVLRDHLINNARTFIFSTAMPPYLAAQVRASLRLAVGMDGQREALLSRSAVFANLLRVDGWNTMNTVSQIVPAVIGENAAALHAARFLQNAGFAVRAIRPPTVPQGTSRLRFSITSSIPLEQLHRLAKSLHEWRRQSQSVSATHLSFAESA
jgi:8-amino-7-oxononanoate synthase